MSDDNQFYIRVDDGTDRIELDDVPVVSDTITITDSKGELIEIDGSGSIGIGQSGPIHQLTWVDPRDEEIKELKKKVKELEDMIVEHILLHKHDNDDS